MLAESLRGSGAQYLVMDAGWYKPEKGSWESAHGDWVPNPTLYTDGLRATSGFLGRLCFSGDLLELNGDQSNRLQTAVGKCFHPTIRIGSAPSRNSTLPSSIRSKRTDGGSTGLTTAATVRW